MAPVVNTAYHRPLQTQPWQRPMARLVGSTVVATLIVTGVVGYWIASRETRERTPSAPSATTISATSISPRNSSQTAPPPAPLEAGGPGIRPINPGDEDGRNPTEPVTPTPPVSAAGPSVEPPPRAAADDFDRAAAERRVRAALLERPRAMTTKPRRNRATATRATGSEANHHSTTNAAPAAEQPDPAPTPPAAATKPPASDPSSNVVDGRRIRTSL